MSIAKRLETAEAALAKRNGETGYKLVVLRNGETEDDAKKRLGLEDWRGPIAFLSEEDIKLG
jgi:hypothetical protein